MTDIREVTYTDENGDPQNAYDYLLKDGNLAVPGGRYGSDTRDCADIAILLFVAFVHANGEDNIELLDDMMSQVVNSGDEVCWTILDNQAAFEGMTVTFTTGEVVPLNVYDYFDLEEIDYARELYATAYGGESATF